MKENIKNEVSGWLALVASLLIVASIGVVCYQIYLWLRLGAWVPMPLSHAFAQMGIDTFSSVTDISWVGLKKVIEWLLDVSVAVWLLVLAMICAVIGNPDTNT